MKTKIYFFTLATIVFLSACSTSDNSRKEVAKNNIQMWLNTNSSKNVSIKEVSELYIIEEDESEKDLLPKVDTKSQGNISEYLHRTLTAAILVGKGSCNKGIFQNIVKTDKEYRSMGIKKGGRFVMIANLSTNEARSVGSCFLFDASLNVEKIFWLEDEQAIFKIANMR